MEFLYVAFAEGSAVVACIMLNASDRNPASFIMGEGRFVTYIYIHIYIYVYIHIYLNTSIH